MSYLELTSELTGTLPGLSDFLAANYIARAYQDILKMRLWSFQTLDASVVCPAQITTGTAAFTQYASPSTVVMDAAATAALTPFLTGTPRLIQMQIRFGGPNNTSSVGQVYQIQVAAIVGGFLTLTLDRPIVEATATASGYQVYRCYVAVPVSDFLRWLSIVDMANGFDLTLDRTSEYFDSMDPQRQSQGLAYYVGAFQQSTSVGQNPLGGTQLYELWPHPVQGQTFYVKFQRQGPFFVAQADTQPAPITDQMILQKAEYAYAYRWARANAGRDPKLARTNWNQAIKDTRDDFRLAYVDAKRQDEEIRLTSVFARGHGLRNSNQPNYPIDAEFIQTHLVSF